MTKFYNISLSGILILFFLSVIPLVYGDNSEKLNHQDLQIDKLEIGKSKLTDVLETFKNSKLISLKTGSQRTSYICIKNKSSFLLFYTMDSIATDTLSGALLSRELPKEFEQKNCSINLGDFPRLFNLSLGVEEETVLKRKPPHKQNQNEYSYFYQSVDSTNKNLNIVSTGVNILFEDKRIVTIQVTQVKHRK